MKNLQQTLTHFYSGFLFCLIILGTSTKKIHAQQSDKDIVEIQKVLEKQQEAWNDGNLEKFMKGYYQSENLKFIGKSGVTYGWEATLARYKKAYPDKKAMGKLTFEIISIEKIEKKSVFVIGKWTLKKDDGEVTGHFSLLWKKIKGEWLIVADHSS
ncbi:MAG: hypothetical protein OHK0038_11820 [Flammeovirgaceae bacterium]